MEVETRWTGSVGTHISLDEMAVLEREARELLPRATDPLALATVHLALAGLPPWEARTLNAQPDEATLERRSPGQGASRESCFHVRNRSWVAPLGPVPSPVPSGRSRNVWVRARSSAWPAQ